MNTQTDQVRTLLAEGELLKIESVLSQVKKWNKELIVMHVLTQVFRREVENGISPTVFDYSLDLDELVRHFVRLKLYVRRLEFDMPDDLQMELYEYCQQNGVSDYFLLYIIQQNVFSPQKVCWRLCELFARAEGSGSSRSKAYEELAETM